MILKTFCRQSECENRRSHESAQNSNAMSYVRSLNPFVVGKYGKNWLKLLNLGLAIFRVFGLVSLYCGLSVREWKAIYRRLTSSYSFMLFSLSFSLSKEEKNRKSI